MLCIYVHSLSSSCFYRFYFVTGMSLTLSEMLTEIQENDILDLPVSEHVLSAVQEMEAAQVGQGKGVSSQTTSGAEKAAPVIDIPNVDISMHADTSANPHNHISIRNSNEKSSYNKATASRNRRRRQKQGLRGAQESLLSTPAAMSHASFMGQQLTTLPGVPAQPLPQYFTTNGTAATFNFGNPTNQNPVVVELIRDLQLLRDWADNTLSKAQRLL